MVENDETIQNSESSAVQTYEFVAYPERIFQAAKQL
jgi:hypothetical protein